MKEEYSQQEIDDYCNNLLNKFKKDPNYELIQEFGKLLMKDVMDLSEEELNRYIELKSILATY